MEVTCPTGVEGLGPFRLTILIGPGAVWRRFAWVLWVGVRRELKSISEVGYLKSGVVGEYLMKRADV